MKAKLSSRVQKHRDSLRARGLRPIQLWVPDVRGSGFAEECLRQSRAVCNDVAELDHQAWGEAVADQGGWV